VSHQDQVSMFVVDSGERGGGGGGGGRRCLCFCLYTRPGRRA